MTKPEDVKIELNSQVGTSHDPATIKVYVGEKLISEVVASIEQQRGADGGLYPCVILKEKNLGTASSEVEVAEMMMFRFHLLAAAAPEEVSDEVVEEALKSVRIRDLGDRENIRGILERNRPELAKKLEDWLAEKKSTA